MAIRDTQTTLEVLFTGDPDAQVTQVYEEVVREGDPDAQITQVYMEVLREANPRIPRLIVQDYSTAAFTVASPGVR